MIKIKITDINDIEAIVNLRVEQQIEDWNNTSINKDFSVYTDRFTEITRDYFTRNLNKTIYFAIMYLDNLPVAICALEKPKELPQITICEKPNSLSGNLISVYTKPDYRGKGYMQKLLKELLSFAKSEKFTDITLTTNTPDAKHIYEKFGFNYISDKYYLKL